MKLKPREKVGAKEKGAVDEGVADGERSKGGDTAPSVGLSAMPVSWHTFHEGADSEDGSSSDLASQ
jgi:hypothetical protein